LGAEIGRRLLAQKYPVSCYWDFKAAQLRECNGLTVFEPFSGIDAANDALIVLGVANGHIQPELLHRLDVRGFKHVSGMEIYNELICPLSEANFDLSECCKRIECNTDTCRRLKELIFGRFYTEGKLLVDTVFLLVTQKCSLKCKYCIAYMNSYPPEARVHFPAARIIADADILSEACSFIKRVVVYGGEPMLHPELDKIVNRISSKDNIGIVNIVSNGLYKNSAAVLKALDKRKLRIEFSNYGEALTQAQRDIVDRNFDNLVQYGFAPFRHGFTPEWIAPRPFTDKHWDDEYKRHLKSRCAYFSSNKDNRIKESMVVANGRIYPCRMSSSINTLGVADYPDEYINLGDMTSDDFAGSVNKLYAKDYFCSCGHCDEEQGAVVRMAGEQGFDERYALGK
jgi:uncharacterized Fe-S cluster-containing radical SAM superfamily protein